MSTTATASATDLVAGYGDIPVLGPLEFSLQSGVTALLGRNGSGKTTLMRTLCGIIPALGGTCTVLGSPVADGAAVRSKVGYLGHESALARALTVEQNLHFWADVAATHPEADIVPRQVLVERFDLAALMGTRISALSRGQRQRVDLARLAMTDPEFIVMDEPLTGLDPVYAARFRALVSEWGQTRTVLYSSHSVPEALELAQRFLILRGRDLVELDCNRATVTASTILAALEVRP